MKSDNYGINFFRSVALNIFTHLEVKIENNKNKNYQIIIHLE